MHFWNLKKVTEKSMKPMIFRTLFLNTALIVPSLRRLSAMAVQSNHELSVGKP